MVDDALGLEWSVWDADVHLYTQQFPDAGAAEDAARAEQAQYAELGIRRNVEIHLRQRHVSAWVSIGLAALEPPESLLVDERALSSDGGLELRREFRIKGTLDGALRTLSMVDSLGDAAECALLWRHAGVDFDLLEARWASDWRRTPS